MAASRPTRQRHIRAVAPCAGAPLGQADSTHLEAARCRIAAAVHRGGAAEPMSSTLTHHFATMAYNNAWANHRLLTACGNLSQADFEARRTSFFPSIKATLNHNLTVDWYYIDALERALHHQEPNRKPDRFFEPEAPFEACVALACCGPLFIFRRSRSKFSRALFTTTTTRGGSSSRAAVTRRTLSRPTARPAKPAFAATSRLRRRWHSRRTSSCVIAIPLSKRVRWRSLPPGCSASRRR